MAPILPRLHCVICGCRKGNRILSLRWRHNEHDGVSNHQPHGCLLNRLFRRRSKKTSKLLVTGLVWWIHRGIPRTKGQLRGKRSHLMTSSCQWLRALDQRGDGTTLYWSWPLGLKPLAHTITIVINPSVYKLAWLSIKSVLILVTQCIASLYTHQPYCGYFASIDSDNMKAPCTFTIWTAWNRR